MTTCKCPFIFPVYAATTFAISIRFSPMHDLFLFHLRQIKQIEIF